jgi:hypothetical protein
MGFSSNITEIVILILLWAAGIIVMIIVMSGFFKQSRFEPDSHYGTENPAADEKD